MVAEIAEAIKIFYSYAPQDKELRDQLDKHLGALKWSGKIKTWYDRQIQPGMDWEREIDTRLNDADIVLLLVSPDFISSEYCLGVEMTQALEMQRHKKTTVIPIYLRPVDFTGTPIFDLQILPVGSKPVTKWRNRDEAFKVVADGIRGVVENLLERKTKLIEEVLKELLEKYSGLTEEFFTQDIEKRQKIEGASFSSLDLMNVSNFFLQVHRLGEFNLSSFLQEELERLDLLRNGIPGYETLLCFGKQPSQWFPSARTRCVYWHGNNSSIGLIDSAEYSVNLLSQYELGCAFLRKYLRGITDEEGTLLHWDLPFLAVEEALVNALVHREYFNRSDVVLVEVFTNRVEVSSPGIPTSPMILQHLGEEPVSVPPLRNPGISHIFYLSGYIEKVGAGLIRMLRVMEDAGLPSPKFELSTNERFKVILYRSKEASID